jgi:hypothetical protein
MDHQPTHSGVGYLLGSAGTAIWWILDQLWRHGPSWSLVPPLCFGVASLVGALRGYQNDRHRRAIESARLEVELRAAAEASGRRRGYHGGLTFDQLEGRN